MIDVHVPHKSEHTWVDFFIHIGTIAVGLLIAIGLEQTVEHIHKLHEARHARELIADEMRQNLKLVRDQRYNLRMHEEFLFADLAVIDRMRKHAIDPNDHVVLFHPYNTLATAAWETAKQSQLLALLPYDEVQRDATVYELQNEYTDTMTASTHALQLANTMRYHSAADRFDYAKAGSSSAFYGQLGDGAAHNAFLSQSLGSVELARFATDQVDRLEQTVQQAIYADERLINRCDWLERDYKSLLPDQGTR
jgi:hypothetical protein